MPEDTEALKRAFTSMATTMKTLTASSLDKAVAGVEKNIREEAGNSQAASAMVRNIVQAKTGFTIAGLQSAIRTVLFTPVSRLNIADNELERLKEELSKLIQPVNKDTMNFLINWSSSE